MRTKVVGGKHNARVIRDARGWYFSRLCNVMSMSAVEHIWTQILGRDIQRFDHTTSSDPDRQKQKLIKSMIDYIWHVIVNMDHVLGRGDVYY